MDFHPSEEQQILINSTERYVREHYGFEARRAASLTADGFSREHWARFADMGWLGLSLPEEAGGLGGSVTDVALLIEPLGGALLAEPLIDTAILAAMLVGASMNSNARASLGNAIASGTQIAVLAHLEDGARSEYDTTVTTRAARTTSGWKLTGTKRCVFHGASADCWLVTARLDGIDWDDAHGFGVFVLRSDSPGVSVSDYRLIDGTHAADLVLSDATVAADALLLGPDAAPARLQEALDHAVIAATAAALGSMETVLSLTSDYIKQRVQYGRPLGTFQALQHRMAEMFIETDQARSALYHALAAVETGDATLRRRAVSGAKALVAKAGYFVAGQGIQLHGGIGTTDEYAVGHHYKAMLIYDKRFGDIDFHVARSAGLPT
ncbi:acyl-CoA dehydrogenase domain protein (plasmid) [Azospirillum sp. B510]|uniref:acyl-CoA dehydrogenase family protein n=1 Tax=Azospirillum sp. (strain B510) TaxID=137722 RepID=UPI0001C4CC03|nr:acyl-CoA dehydrogenase family protein [Azospirillum sp. B510]BAI74857.1 acyl-CoA dehydrogenase domain protein [Azospirillum sp. B510]